MQPLTYPFDSEEILRKKKRLKKMLLALDVPRTTVKIAVLGGSSTQDIISILELFLLNEGIAPRFYESAYGQYWQEAMFPSEALMHFSPDIIFIHTGFRNLSELPHLQHTQTDVDALLEKQFSHFTTMWTRLWELYPCTIIQNNFERPTYRLLGNQDIAMYQGASHFVSRLNQKFYEYKQQHNSFFIHDLEYLSAHYGLERWNDSSAWYLYKYIMTINAIPMFAYSLSRIVKSLYGKNKKAIACDLDNTLWGGIIGEEGTTHIQLGPEFPLGQAYADFQRYLKQQKDLGVLLCLNSKNEETTAIAGLEHPDGVLRLDDFAAHRINWQRKDENIRYLAQKLNIGEDSFVFIDDNPAEREIVEQNIPSVSTPPMNNVENYIHILDQGGYFEVTNLSTEDQDRNRMYEANRQRQQSQEQFQDYESYLYSLEMQAEILPFQQKDIPRITQLINKTNQFNLTTRRYSEEEVRSLYDDSTILTLAGRLKDRFGDNGLVSALIATEKNGNGQINLWVMSCRVFQRQMETAMMNACIVQGRKLNWEYITGIYTPNAKNQLVQNFYKEQGFSFYKEENNQSFWRLKISKYQEKKIPIIVNGEKYE